jgi:hypothetical protein
MVRDTQQNADTHSQRSLLCRDAVQRLYTIQLSVARGDSIIPRLSMGPTKAIIPLNSTSAVNRLSYTRHCALEYKYNLFSFGT